MMARSRSWQRLASYYKGHRLRVGAALLANLARAGLVGASAVFLQRLVSAVSVAGMGAPWMDAAACLACLLAGSAVGLKARRTILVLTKGVVTGLRDELNEKLHRLAITDIAALGRMRLHTVIVHDTERIDCHLNGLLGVILPAFATLLILAAVMAWMSPAAASLAVLAGSLPLLAALIGSGSRHQDAAQFRQALERFSSGTLLSIERAELARTAASVHYETSQRREDSANLEAVSRDMVWRAARLSELNQVVTALTLLAILCAMVLLNARGRLDLPGAVTILMVLLLMRQQAGGLAAQLPQLAEGNASLRRIFELLDLPEERAWIGDARIAFSGAVQLDGVTVEIGGQRVLDRLSLTLRAGSCTALCGPNGAGKTTLARTLLGLHRLTSGRLLADGMPYEQLDLNQLRRCIGMLPQDPCLFAGSISANIAYGLDQAPAAEVVAAATAAGAHAFIAALPDGYATVLHDAGAPLSGGECQRIMLARALLRGPTLLVLDEPTHHLDEAATDALLDLLRELKASITMLVITHDPKVAALADERLEMANGTIVRSVAPTHAPTHAPTQAPTNARSAAPDDERRKLLA
jgi:ABC-type multidrug transport system fused ATPase/permease subunit